MTVNRAHLLADIWKGSESFMVKELNLLAREVFNEAFDNLISRVETHPISLELSQKQSVDESRFLSVRGNLFSFFGFEASDNPVDELINFLKATIKFFPGQGMTVKGVKGYLPARATYPTRDDFDLLGLSWEPNRSWVYAIEEGVNNLGYYLFVARDSSRSGKGIQSKHQIRSAQFIPTPYISPIIEQFKKELT
jgi:hypothetical protein